MCGITAYIQGPEPESQNSVSEVTTGLQRLVYRGYDSWGYATDNGETRKEVGEIPDKEFVGVHSEAVIGHTRWATHGGVTEANAHPHESCDGRFAVVHNGIIENHEEIKNMMSKEAASESFENAEEHSYKSETDTEVIPHFIEHELRNFENQTVSDALHTFDQTAEGNYAIVVLDREEKQLYGLKRGSPLVFAMPKAEEVQGFEGAYFASDLYAISDKTDEAYFMKDGDLIQTSGNNLAHWNNGELQEGPLDTKSFEWTEEEPELGEDNQYWMEKEIKEIPEAINRLNKSLENEQKEKLENFKSRIEDDYDKVVFTASGTSYHAALLGAYYFQQNGINAQALIASEFDSYQHVNQDTLVIALSQSGETRDVLDAMNSAWDAGAKVASIVNVPHSTIQRKSDFSLEIKAQQENCVAATKTFTNQVYTLMKLAGADTFGVEQINTVNNIGMLALQDAQEFHEQGHEDIYIIGESSTYPVAREIALKLKEIPYIHAEGMMAGELKHGTLALVEEGTPVICLDDGSGSIESTVEEVEARGARTKKLSEKEMGKEAFIFKSAIYGFMLAMYWAHLKELPVDRPRNLAKSVTVK